jgi:peptidoglycan/xylan/chitin deacetylase (PgdA/CDA1 family)
MEATDRDPTYWGPERASYDDELDAWRERTARPAMAVLDGFDWPDRSPRGIDLDVPRSRVGDLELRVEAA